MGALVPVHAPVTGQQCGRAGGTRAGGGQDEEQGERCESTPDDVAVKEREICSGKIWTLLALTD